MEALGAGIAEEAGEWGWWPLEIEGEDIWEGWLSWWENIASSSTLIKVNCNLLLCGSISLAIIILGDTSIELYVSITIKKLKSLSSRKLWMRLLESSTSDTGIVSFYNHGSQRPIVAKRGPGKGPSTWLVTNIFKALLVDSTMLQVLLTPGDQPPFFAWDTMANRNINSRNVARIRALFPDLCKYNVSFAVQK